MLASQLATRAEMPFADYVRLAVCEPLDVGLDPTGDPGIRHARVARATCSPIGRELLRPHLVAEETRDEMVAVQFPGLSGVLPDYGRFDPLDWGLGVQLNTSPPIVDGGAHVLRGRSGTSEARERSSGSTRAAAVVCAALTTREFGEWAKEAWPRFSDAVLGELG